MKFKKVKTDDLTGGLMQVAGAGVGFMLPNGIANAVAKIDNEIQITEQQKQTKMYVNAALLALGLYGILAIDGNDATSNGLKALSGGIAGGGVKGLITHFASSKVQEMPSGTVKTIMAGALGCPCNSVASSYPTLQMPSSLRMPRSLRMPFSENELVATENILENFNLQS